MSLTDERIIEIVSTGGAVQCREVLREPLRFGAVSYRFFTSGLLEFARAVERESALKWTDALPTEQGWYWWSFDPIKDPRPSVFWVTDEIMGAWREMHYIMGGQAYRAKDLGGQWAGPIPEPEE